MIDCHLTSIFLKQVETTNYMQQIWRDKCNPWRNATNATSDPIFSCAICCISARYHWGNSNDEAADHQFTGADGTGELSQKVVNSNLLDLFFRSFFTFYYGKSPSNPINLGDHFWFTFSMRIEFRRKSKARERPRQISGLHPGFWESSCFFCLGYA